MPSPALNIILRNGLLAETQKYIATSGAQDARNIDAFIRTLMAEGLWGSLVECWLMRSSQNAGTGSDAFGLKRVADGTLANGPSWASNGINFATDTSTGRSSFISCPWAYDIRTNCTTVIISDAGVGAVFTSGFQYFAGSNSSANSTMAEALLRYDNGAQNTIIAPQSIGVAGFGSSALTLASGIPRAYVIQRKTNTPSDATPDGNRAYIDSVLTHSGSNSGYLCTNATASFVIGNRGVADTVAHIGKISFVGVWADWTISPSAIRAILKNTILQGVLP
ncbi:MAG: hypothetical protein ABIP97_13850 [Chthoniobacterales bacterium]